MPHAIQAAAWKNISEKTLASKGISFMVSVISKTSARTWANAITRPAREFPLTPLTIVEGQIPDRLRGTLYRNGPARLQRGHQAVGHWFDGDGAILGVRFTETGATGLYRYVQTAGYQAEEQAGQFLFGNYGMKPAGPFWKHFGESPKNAANTSVLALDDRLLALWEGGLPHRLDLDTLETRGTETLGALDDQSPYSAHPKVDAVTGEIFNFGVSLGPQVKLNLYRSQRDGQIQHRSQIPLNGVPLLHDFALAGPYLIFVISPVRLNLWPILFNLQSFSDALTWKPQLGTQILVVDRETLALVSRTETDPWFQWHCGNGFVNAQGEAVITFVRYPDFQTNQRLKEVASGEVHTVASGTYYQMRLHPQSGKVLEVSPLLDEDCEFPIVPPSQVGQPWSQSYLVGHRPHGLERGELYGAIVRYDHTTGTVTVADTGENHYVTEPIYAPDPANADQGWILSVIYDGDRDCSEVWIWDSDRLAEAPVCKLALPSVVPMGFHGTWKGA